MSDTAISTDRGAGDRAAEVRIALGLFALTALVRLICLFGSVDRAWPHSTFYEGDAPRWADWAAALARGEPYQFDLPIWSPAVAYVMFFAGKLEVTGFLSLKVIWCLLSAATVSLAYTAFRREFSRRVSFFAAGVCLAATSQYQLATSLNNETLYQLLVVLIVLISLRRDGWGRSVGLGVLHGTAILVRAEHMLLVLMLAAWDWFDACRMRSDLTPRGARRLIIAAIRPGVMCFVGVVVCLPWSVHATRATARYNDTAIVPADYSNAEIPLTPDARAFFDAMPAFCRGQNLMFACHAAREERAQILDAATALAVLLDAFGTLPEPLRTPVFVSSQGPLSFALANHPAAEGGFSLAALDERMSDPGGLNLAIPSHLYLYNHGYAAGWEYVARDPQTAIANAGRKCARFARGLTPAFTSLQIPFGRDGLRAAVDLTTPQGVAPAVLTLLAVAVIIVGCTRALTRGSGRLWLMVVAYKLAVTILFYGYARQAASVLPAFAVLAASGAAWPAVRLHVPVRTRSIGLVGVVALIAGADAWVAATHPVVEVTGRAEAAPRFGREAWTSSEGIVLTIRARDRSTADIP